MHYGIDMLNYKGYDEVQVHTDSLKGLDGASVDIKQGYFEDFVEAI